MIITERAKQYMYELSEDGQSKAFHLFLSETCCGNGVGLKIMPKKERKYVEVDGLAFHFERDMLLFLHGMVIDTIEANGNITINIQTV
jgi:Fe-S cluster assembly iron-binding protein IscA